MALSARMVSYSEGYTTTITKVQHFEMSKVEDGDLENILQCPVCLEIPKSNPIHQCDRGHHLCEPCFQRLRDNRCPICKANFYGTRNFIAEELIKIFPCLKIDVPSAQVPSRQIDETGVRVKVAPSLCRGQFPCLFGKCNRNFGAGTMLRHIRDQHRPFLVEVSARNKHTEEWDFHYVLDSTYVEAIRISNMGLFFLVLKMDNKGLLHATVQMVASEEVAPMFKFKMKIMDVDNKTKISFKDRVFPCHDRITNLAENGHCLEFDTKKFSYLQNNGCFLCSISIIDGRE